MTAGFSDIPLVIAIIAVLWRLTQGNKITCFGHRDLLVNETLNMQANIMKMNTSHAHDSVQSLPEDADEMTAVSDLSEDRKSDRGNSVGQQIGQLTSRELEVLQFIAEGKLNKQAASELSISIKTVEKHRDHLAKKLGIRGIAGLTHFAIYAGIVRCDPQLAVT